METVVETDSFKAIGNRILVLPEEQKESKTAGGIIVPESYETLKAQFIKGKVISVGEKLSDQIQVGDIVCYQKLYELSINVKKVRHVILKGEHIIGYSRD